MQFFLFVFFLGDLKSVFLPYFAILSFDLYEPLLSALTD